MLSKHFQSHTRIRNFQMWSLLMINKPKLKRETWHVKIILEDKILNDTNTKAYHGMNSKTFPFISITRLDTAVEMDFSNYSTRFFQRPNKKKTRFLMSLQSNKITNRM